MGPVDAVHAHVLSQSAQPTNSHFTKPRIYRGLTGVWCFRWYTAQGMRFVQDDTFERICLRARFVLRALAINASSPSAPPSALRGRT